MSKDGNLTVLFDRSIVIPEVFKNLVVDNKRRSLAENDFTFHDVVEIFVISTFHDD